MDHRARDLILLVGRGAGAAGLPADGAERSPVAHAVLACHRRAAQRHGDPHRAQCGGAFMLTVKERGHFVATMRHAHVTLMETLAAWVPTTPEMEVKLLLGGHIWDVAQHADSLGKRTYELRLPLQHSVRPAEGYVDFVTEVAAIGPTPQRLAAMYDVLIPALGGRQRRYVEQTDRLVDAPTVRILERYLADVARMLDAAHALRRDLPALQPVDSGWVATLQAREAALELLAAVSVAGVAVGA